MIKIIFILLTGVISISFAAIFVRFCEDVPAIMIATYRLSIPAIILIAISIFKKGTFLNMDRKELFLCFMGGLFLTLHLITWFTSLKYTSVASSVVLVTTSPLFIGLFTVISLKEKFNAGLTIGIVLSLTGSLIIGINDTGIKGLMIKNSSAFFGDSLAIAGAIMASGYLIIGSMVRKKLGILTYITVVYSFSALMLILISLALHIPFTGYKSFSSLNLVLLAIIPQLIGHSSFNWILKHIAPALVSIIILMEPAAASVLAYIFFKEHIDFFQFTGMMMILLAIFIASKKGFKGV